MYTNVTLQRFRQWAQEPNRVHIYNRMLTAYTFARMHYFRTETTGQMF